LNCERFSLPALLFIRIVPFLSGKPKQNILKEEKKVAEWKKIGMAVGIGAVAGAADQLIQNYDENRALKMRAAGTLAADAKMPIVKQFGTYLNYGVPVLAVIATAMGWVKDDLAISLVTAGGQLAGRKVTHQFSTRSTSPTPSAAYTEWARQQARERSYNPEFDKAHVFRVTGQL
jgi:hypothetical protein